MSEFEMALFMSCGNFSRLRQEGNKIIADCPGCDFSCGWPKTKQRFRTFREKESVIK